MGVGFVIVAWGVIGSVLAGVGALILRWLMALLTPGADGNRRQLIRAATLFPFACLVWAGAVFVFQAFVNVVLLHRDIGVGDGFDCPLPDGYAMSFIDVTDIGTLYNPKGYPLWTKVRDNAVNNVRLMQLAGRYILGASDTNALDHFGQAGNPVDSYFLLDIQTGTRANFKTYDELRWAAEHVGIQSGLVPISRFYSKYRFTWFDAFAGILLIALPLVRAMFLMRWTLRVRRTCSNPAISA